MVAPPPNWLFSALSFMGVIFCVIPLPWHLQAWNTGTIMFMFWTGVGCLNLFINSVLWNSDVINKAPVWCDISTQIQIAGSVAIPACSLCINRRLYHIASVQSVTKSRAQKRRDVIIDLAIGLGIPFLQLCLHPIVQSHRFAIYEQLGCVPFTFNTPAAYPLYLIWPIFIGLVSAFYAIRTIRELAIRRAQFKEFLSTNKNLSSSRYFRLMGLAGAEIIFTVPLASFFVWMNLTVNPVQAYINWDNAHAGFSTIYQIPAILWQADPLATASLELPRYSYVLCAFVFFAFFGFADEARKNYRLAGASVAKRVGLSTGSLSTTGTWTANGTNPDTSYTHSSTMPVYITQQSEKKRDSFASFSSRMSLPDLGGALTDVKKGPYSPTATSLGTMSKESLAKSPMDLDGVPLPTLPESTLDMSSPPPQYALATPRAV